MPASRRVVVILLLSVMALGGCGGGSDGGGNNNQAPTASFTASVTSGPAPLAVNFTAGASTDADGSIASYSWNFGDGTAVATGVTVSHTYTAAGSFTVTLTVTDNDGATGQTTAAIQVTGPPPESVIVSGIVTYDRVPFSVTVSDVNGLNYGGTVAQPVRGAVAELLDSSLNILATTVTDSTGLYTFTAPANTNVLVRIKAQSVATGTPSWDISVLNNTNSNALYALDSTVFSTGTANVTLNLNAESGWPDLGGTSYFDTRAAAPFAVLDTLYSAVQFVVTQGNTAVNLPALSVFWSPENKPSEEWDPATGAIQTTLFLDEELDGFPAGIYVLGWENVDTDEYDAHVIAHEFQHYLESALSRSDSPGGSHAINEMLDMRVSFSEGFANAFSGMALNDPQYRDSFDVQQGSSFNFNMESNVFDPEGWYNEGSIYSLIWDMYDSVPDDADDVQLGYSPLFEVFRNELRTGQALTSIFPLATALKAQAGAPVAALDALVAAQSIRASDIDAFGTTETNSGGVAEALPLYRDITLNGGGVIVCGSATAGTYNKIGNRRFLKFSLANAGSITIRVVSNGTGIPEPDPDFWLFGNGEQQVSEEATPNVEQATFDVPAGEYVIEVYEYSHIDPAASNDVSRGQTCMNVTITG